MQSYRVDPLSSEEMDEVAEQAHDLINLCTDRSIIKEIAQTIIGHLGPQRSKDERAKQFERAINRAKAELRSDKVTFSKQDLVFGINLARQAYRLSHGVFSGQWTYRRALNELKKMIAERDAEIQKRRFKMTGRRPKPALPDDKPHRLQQSKQSPKPRPFKRKHKKTQLGNQRRKAA